ncbi:uncharacterized protein A4U43_C03F10450 [Asparagus officinalis]|uniref:Uncharacterized protein n=1 Tax=Asparagus officinalis TaxID=4686 RepID=A0A5P1F8V6_ASPOF|nr:uncharacterized protein A4U43_C03F10450 [Asparagus officinalis]
MIKNTFYEFESDYIKMMPVKVWHVGPVSLRNRDADDKVVRGGESGENLIKHCLNWLDGEKPGSVLYVCFGSLSRFTCSQLREIALGVETSGYSFILAIENCGDKAERMPEKFEKRV